MVLKVEVKGLKALQASLKKKIEEQSNTKAADISKTVIAELKNNTPVDTGEARDGWSLSKEGKTLQIVNTVTHISILNEGHSQQAPTHFIEKTVLGVPGVKPNGVIVESK